MEPGVRRIKLVIEYDGADFAGYQSQGKGERTVQQTLDRAVKSIADHDVVIHVAGRTDAGVHALGQVVHFDLRSGIPTDRILPAMNGKLPSDVAVRSAVEVDAGFHARFSAVRRTYIYLIRVSPTRSALWARYSLTEREPLDGEAMRDAGNAMVGARDFASLANAGGDPGSTTVRDLQKVAIRSLSDGRVHLVTVSANAFLRGMVRNVVGVLLLAGKGELKRPDIEAILEAKDRRQNPCATAPPRGLCLVRVDY